MGSSYGGVAGLPSTCLYYLLTHLSCEARNAVADPNRLYKITPCDPRRRDSAPMLAVYRFTLRCSAGKIGNSTGMRCFCSTRKGMGFAVTLDPRLSLGRSSPRRDLSTSHTLPYTRGASELNPPPSEGTVQA